MVLGEIGKISMAIGATALACLTGCPLIVAGINKKRTGEFTLIVKKDIAERAKKGDILSGNEQLLQRALDAAIEEQKNVKIEVELQGDKFVLDKSGAGMPLKEVEGKLQKARTDVDAAKEALDKEVSNKAAKQGELDAAQTVLTNMESSYKDVVQNTDEYKNAQAKIKKLTDVTSRLKSYTDVQQPAAPSPLKA